MKKSFLISSLMLIGGVSVIVSQTFASDEPTMCTMEYMPVCAAVQVQCIKAPCPPINQTFGNACSMNADKSATFLYTGECIINEFANTKWELIDFNRESSLGTKILYTGIDISFTDTTLSAHVCNIFNGSYKLDGTTLIVDQMMSTKMACMDNLAMYESAFDLSGAHIERYGNLSNFMMISTVSGKEFIWKKINESTGIANPASVNCTDNGGTLNIIDGKDGQYGMCTFKDGSQCEEWAYFRGQCKPTNEKLQTVLSNYLSVVRFTEDGYKQFFVNLKTKIDLGLSSASGATKKAYMQIANFLKSY